MRIQSHLKNLRISLFGNKTGTFLKGEKDKSFIINYLSFYLVPRPGVEPGWMLLHWCLRPARLPIPPSGLFCLCGAKVNKSFDNTSIQLKKSEKHFYLTHFKKVSHHFFKI